NQGKAYDEIGNRLASNNDREPAQPADAIKNATRHGLRKNQEQRQTKNGKGWITPTHIFRSHPQGKERPAEQIKSCLDWQNDPKHEPRTVEKDETNCGHVTAGLEGADGRSKNGRHCPQSVLGILDETGGYGEIGNEL